MTLLHLILLSLGKSTPLLLAGLGGLLSELSGVINFALEGMMLAGAFGAVWAASVSGSPWVGLLGGAMGGVFIALLHGFSSLVFRANQIVSAIALNLLAAGLSGMLLNQVFNVYGTSPAVERLPSLGLLLPRVLSAGNGRWAESVGGLSVLVPLALTLALATIAFFRGTAWGLNIRACGENPLAASAAGLSVLQTRFFCLIASGVLAGMGGAYLSIGELSQFVEHMTQGRGYLAIAALILGRWTPVGVLLATLFFGFCEALSEWLAVRWTELPHQVFLALPYLICFVVLILRIGKRQPPSALGQL